MCGLTAYFSLGDETISIKKFIEINNAIKHRGPDDEGYYFSNNSDDITVAGGKDTPEDVIINKKLHHLPDYALDYNNPQTYKYAIGHRRLSICDVTSAGHQPYFEKNNNSILIFNGEIYNFEELKLNLIKNGSVFHTKSDTEVLYKMFSQNKNKNSLKELNGMFSFIYFNYETKKIYVARDRYGVKPLYYFVKPNQYILFGSEMKQFLKINDFKKNLDKNIINDFLKYDMVESGNDKTIFKEIKKVEPGSLIEFDISKKNEISMSKTFYYNLSFDRQKKKIHYQEEFKNLFNSSVKIRLPKEVNFASCLSGGIDSTIVSLIANKFSDGGISTLNFKSDIKEYDETEYYNEVISKNKFRNNYIANVKTNDVIDDFSKVVFTHDQPFSNGSVLAEYYLYKEAKKNNFKVVLDGHGADESFLGYEIDLINYYKKILVKNNLKISNIGKFNYGLKYILRFLKKVRSKISNINSINLDYTNSKLETDLKIINLNKYILFLLYNNFAKQLTSVDRNSMAFGIENRSPFLDFNLINFISNCPPEYLFKDLDKKTMIKNSYGAYIPEKILKRKKKIGYSSEEKAWNDKNMENFYFEKIEYGKKNINLKLYEELHNNFNTYKDNKSEIFKFVTFSEWYRLFSSDKTI